MIRIPKNPIQRSFRPGRPASFPSVRLPGTWVIGAERASVGGIASGSAPSLVPGRSDGSNPESSRHPVRLDREPRPRHRWEQFGGWAPSTDPVVSKSETFVSRFATNVSTFDSEVSILESEKRNLSQFAGNSSPVAGALRELAGDVPAKASDLPGKDSIIIIEA